MRTTAEPYYIVDERLSPKEIAMLPILLPAHYELMRQHGSSAGETMPSGNLELRTGTLDKTIEVDEEEVIEISATPREYHTVATLKGQALSYQIGMEERLSAALNGISADSDEMAVAVNIPHDAFPEDGLVVSAYPCWYGVSYRTAGRLFESLAARGIDDTTPGFPVSIANSFRELARYSHPDSVLNGSRWLIGFLLAVAPDLYNSSEWRAERSLSIHRRVGADRFTLVSSFAPLKPDSNSITYGIDRSRTDGNQIYHSHECDTAETPAEFAALRELVARDLVVYWLIEGSGQKDRGGKWFRGLVPGFGR
jgi:hypothetical protein